MHCGGTAGRESSQEVSEETVKKRNFLYCSIYPTEDVPIPSLSVYSFKTARKTAPSRKRSLSVMVTSLLLDNRVLDISIKRVK